MKDLQGKTAFVTGGAGGIGFAMARAFVNEGMNVVIADVDAQALATAEAALTGANTQVMAVQLDVTDRAQYAQVAAAVEERFGPVHVLCNNAGVYRGGGMDNVTYADWDWIMGVNVGGVINGVQTFVQRMEAHGQGGHIVNTASMAGMVTSAGLGVYNTSKFAVVGLSEALRTDLQARNIGVSVLCPGMVRTRILESERTRPATLNPDSDQAEQAAQAHSVVMNMAMQTGIDPAEVAQRVVEAIRNNQLYIFPHPEMRDATAARFAAIMDSFDEPDPERVAAQERFMAGLLTPGKD
ncbi:MAG: SDR family NAD(P)-dependent oxidoreductase [Pseudomonadales bacterium]|nr:SDR family NAD(P)-dependent oxidoreductase [Pseudomonadales bacterium]MCP5185645.1 SDR family NAD(P)-dependent oxidoreductase [Pseudomonadales bacterium]